LCAWRFLLDRAAATGALLLETCVCEIPADIVVIFVSNFAAANKSSERLMRISRRRRRAAADGGGGVTSFV
jgi:hypothetical protein